MRRKNCYFAFKKLRTIYAAVKWNPHWKVSEEETKRLGFQSENTGTGGCSKIYSGQDQLPISKQLGIFTRGERSFVYQQRSEEW